MATAESTTVPEIEILRYQHRLVRDVMRANIADVTHEQSLIQPQPAGNCLNWVLGHVLEVYNSTLMLLGGEPVMDTAVLGRYKRGSEPVRDAAEAVSFEQLVSAWDEAVARIDAALAQVTPEALDRSAPSIPGSDQPETLRTLLTTILMHQIYHTGQTGVLRRIIGKPGAIA